MIQKNIVGQWKVFYTCPLYLTSDVNTTCLANTQWEGAVRMLTFYNYPGV